MHNEHKEAGNYKLKKQQLTTNKTKHGCYVVYNS